MIFSESFGQNKSFVGSSHVYSCRSLYSYFFGMKKLIRSEYPNLCILEKFDRLTGFSRFESSFPSGLLCPSYIFVGKRLTELSLNLKESLSIWPKIHCLKRKQVIRNFSSVCELD